jgi:hypothetical protein
MGPNAFREYRRQNLAEQDRLEGEVRRDLASPTYSSDRFVWDNSGIVTVATVEISDLGRGLNVTRGAKLRIQSARTKTVAWFTCDGSATDTEGDLLYWEFKGEGNGRAITVLVYND